MILVTVVGAISNRKSLEGPGGMPVLGVAVALVASGCGPAQLVGFKSD